MNICGDKVKGYQYNKSFIDEKRENCKKLVKNIVPNDQKLQKMVKVAAVNESFGNFSISSLIAKLFQIKTLTD